MMKISLILLIVLSLSCTSNGREERTASQRISKHISKPITFQYSVSIEINDLSGGDTIKSHSWDPGWHGWDVGKPIPDSIIINIMIETTPFEFETNKPFDFFLNAVLQLKGSSTWDCMNPKNPILSEKKVIIRNKEISKNDFFIGEHKADNLTKVYLSYIVKLGDFLNETEQFYKMKDLMFILNALIITVELVEKGNLENKCLIEHYFPVCLESSKTIFDF